MALSGDGGKGYGRRPNLVPNDQVENNWSKIFGKTQPAKTVDDEALNVYNEERLVSKYDKENIKGTDETTLDRDV
jgi:hypothetical protein